MEHGDVLVVDDNPLTREYVAQALCNDGYTVRTTDNPIEALMEILLRLPDILLISVLPADLRSAKFLNCLHGAFADIPVILVLDDVNVAQPLIARANIVAYLVKPYFLRELRTCIHAHIRLRMRTV